MAKGDRWQVDVLGDGAGSRAEAWRSAGGPTEYDGHFGRSTFEATIDRFYTFDVVVHTWDLARAAGLPEYEAFSDEEQARIVADVAAIGDPIRSPGVLAPVVPVSDDADAQTRFLALLGRRA